MAKVTLKGILRISRSIIIITVIFVSLQSVWAYHKYSSQLWSPDQINTDAASQWHMRLRGIKDDLPQRGVIGYVSEQDYPGLSYSPTDSDEEFVLTQYALAPLILDRGNVHHELVLGNFAGEFDYQFERDMGIKLIHFYGYGIYLFAGVTP